MANAIQVHRRSGNQVCKVGVVPGVEEALLGVEEASTVAEVPLEAEEVSTVVEELHGAAREVAALAAALAAEGHLEVVALVDADEDVDFLS